MIVATRFPYNMGYEQSIEILAQVQEEAREPEAPLRHLHVRLSVGMPQLEETERHRVRRLQAQEV